MNGQDLDRRIANVNAATINRKKAALLAQQLQSEGSLIFRDLLDAGQIQALRAALEQALAEDEARYGAGYKFRGMVHALMARGRPFLDLLDHEKIRLFSRAVLGHGCIVHAYNSSSMPPQATNYSRSIHVDSPRLIPGYITNLGMTIALDPFTPESGGMSIMPDSYQLAEPPAEETFAATALQPRLEPGDAIVFNARCWHRGGQNRTANWRHSVTLNVCRAYMRQQFDYPRMLDEQGIDDVSEDVKQFLGYFVRMPASMADFQLPPHLRPYRSGQE